MRNRLSGCQRARKFSPRNRLPHCDRAQSKWPRACGTGAGDRGQYRAEARRPATSLKSMLTLHYNADTTRPKADLYARISAVGAAKVSPASALGEQGTWTRAPQARHRLHCRSLRLCQVSRSLFVSRLAMNRGCCYRSKPSHPQTSCCDGSRDMLFIAKLCRDTVMTLRPQVPEREVPRKPRRAMLGKSTMMDERDSVTFVASPDLPALELRVRKCAAVAVAIFLAGAKA